MEYKYLDLASRDGVSIVRFKQAKIIDQVISDNIAKELSQAELDSAGNRKLLLNFQGVTFLTSAMLGKLLQLGKLCKNDKIQLKLCSICPPLMDVFKISQLHEVFSIEPDEAAGVAAFA